MCGGKSLRFGRSKALEILGGQSLIEIVIERLKALTDRILLVTSKESLAHLASVKVETATDIYPGKGPLGGIYTGLVVSQTLLNVVVACDMPFLNVELLRYMIKLSNGYDAVVPKLEKGMIEPLHAVYSRNCVDSIKARLDRNDLRLRSFLDAVKVRYIAREEYEPLDPQLLSFFNINEQSDFQRAIALAKRQITPQG
ncbi:MAG: molybdenum cofactor guanylyltransferase [Chloroflexota bacterium]